MSGRALKVERGSLPKTEHCEAMEADQESFLRDEFFSLTLMATVQRAGVYRRGTSERRRQEFQMGLRSVLEETAQQYENGIDEETHIRHIVAISASLSRAHADVLHNGRFRIGSAQKALNLYLKYLWCLEKIEMPPHCPFDSQIIAQLHTYDEPKWTALDDVADYRKLVAAAKYEAKGVALAKWELAAYQKRGNKAA